MEKEEDKKVNTPAANATSTTKEMTETEKLARTPNVSIATPKVQKFDAVDAPTPKVKPTEPTSWQQFMDDYEAKQHNNAIQERAITQLHDKERQAQEKRQRSRQIINSIADGLSAISNIVTTAHGAPDLGIGKTLLTQKSQERYDKLQKTADDRRKDYLKIVQGGNRKDLESWLTAKKEERAAGDKERELKVKEAEQQRKDLQERRLQAESTVRTALLNAKVDIAEAEALVAELNAAKTPEMLDLKAREILSRIYKNNRTGGSGSGSGSGGKGKNKKTVKIKKYKAKADGTLEKDYNGKPIPDGETTITIYEGTPEWDYYKGYEDVSGSDNSGNSQSKDESKTIPGKRSDSKSKDNSKTIPGKRKQQ